MDTEKIIQLSTDAGFTHAGELDAEKFEFLQEVRDMCAADKCHKYNNSWSCPPACGTLDEMREKTRKYKRGILVQTVARLEDSFDFEGMAEAGMRHAQAFAKLWDALEPLYPGLFPMGTGGCSRCMQCTYPDAPCRFPERMSPSMEACGLLVSQVCLDNGMAYNHGKDTLAYTACFLLE